MRKFPIFIFFLTIFSSCTNDSVVVNNDSVLDTANHNLTTNDTNPNNVDTGKDSQNNTVIHYDCSVLNRVLPNDSNQKQIRKDLQELVHCGIDSFDFLYVVPNLLPGFMSENHIEGNKNVTYKDFIKHMNEFKATDAYAQLHERVFTLDSLKSIPFDGKKVYAMKPVLGHLGFTEEEWEQFQGFSRTYPIPKKGVFTWGDMVEAFDKYKPQ